jgi:uncharacterized membrane protein
MTELIPGTAHGDAPLAAAHEPDARVSGLESARQGDELSSRTVTINQPLEVLYDFWRQPRNVQLILDNESPQWDRLQIDAEPGKAITWQSAADDPERVSGRIEFRVAPFGRGTEVTVKLATEPRSFIGKTVDALKHRNPMLETRRALRRFKQLMETGEISTAAPGPAAPRGA